MLLNERKKRKSIPFLVVFILLSLLSAYHFPLFESTEGRYAEIAREMLVSGNWLIPELQGIIHFHKPPLSYWLMAAGMDLFGINPLGVRFFGIVAAVIALIFTRKAAYLLTRDDDTADCALLITGSTLLFFASSSIVSTDIYLTCSVIVALYLVFRAADGCNGIIEGSLLGIVLGLGFLIKGPTILLFVAVPSFFVSVFNKNYRNLFNFPFLISGLLFFGLVGLPWFIHIVSMYPSALDYFISYQLLERMTTDIFNRQEAWYFYFAVLFGLCPVFLYSIWGLLVERCSSKFSLFWFFLIPFIVFQFSSSKLTTYLLPYTPLLGIAAAAVLINLRSSFALFIGHIYMAGFILIPTVASFALPFLYSHRLILMFVSLILALFYITLLGGFRYGKGFIVASAWTVLFMSIPVDIYMIMFESELKGYRKLTEASMNQGEGEQIPVAVYNAFLPSVSFYRNEIVPTIKGRERETQFQSNLDYKKLNISTEIEAINFFRDKDIIYLVTEPENRNELQALYGYSCTEEKKGYKYSLLYCSRQ